MNKERMTILLEIMRDVEADETKAKHFNMAHWLGRNVVGEDHACGTSACAAGYAALDPRLQAKGLHLKAYVVRRDSTRREQAAILTKKEFDQFIKEHNELGDCRADIEFGDRLGFDARECFFGLDPNTTKYLFDPDHYRNLSSTKPAEVIERIEYVLEHGEAPRDDC